MSPSTPIACTLSPDQLPDRLEKARRLGEEALVGLEVSERRAVLRFAGHRPEVDALVEAESACCSFFGLSVDDQGEHVTLEIVAPEGAEAPLRSLVAGVVAGWEGGSPGIVSPSGPAGPSAPSAGR